MKLLSFLFAASLLFLGCKKVATTPDFYYGTFEVSKSLYYLPDSFTGKDSLHIAMGADLAFISSKNVIQNLPHNFMDTSMIVKANDSILLCSDCCCFGGYAANVSYYTRFTDIDSPIHWQISGSKIIKDFSYTSTTPMPYYNITFPDTIHYHQGFSIPCSFTNADSVVVNFDYPSYWVVNGHSRTKTFSGNINSISFSSNYFADIQDSVVFMSFDIYNQHTELVNGNHYIFRKANYVAAKTIIVP